MFAGVGTLSLNFHLLFVCLKLHFELGKLVKIFIVPPEWSANKEKKYWHGNPSDCQSVWCNQALYFNKSDLGCSGRPNDKNPTSVMHFVSLGINQSKSSISIKHKFSCNMTINCKRIPSNILFVEDGIYKNRKETIITSVFGLQHYLHSCIWWYFVRN